jgi:hypothetical protein
VKAAAKVVKKAVVAGSSTSVSSPALPAVNPRGFTG